VGIAVGPVGRNAGVSGNIHGGQLASKDGGPHPIEMAPCYAYSHSKGLFIGMCVFGSPSPLSSFTCLSLNCIAAILLPYTVHFGATLIHPYFLSLL